ncbi:MAG: inositol monophosphatase [Bacteroidales bacterium]|nr:inositol monophosphatase [Bacteroidales bacterium]MCF8388091.1 inositol monophosphatase [Bacteroidales bacterium]
MNYQLISTQLKNLARATGAYIREELNKIQERDIKEKGSHDYVTYVDIEAENRLVSELGRLIPGSGFIVEENKELQKSGEYNWIIDPLDGTTNFIQGIPLFAISIALEHKNKVVAGLVYEINTQECFYAWEGSPAYMNRAEIRVSEKTELESSLFATGFPYSDYSRLDNYLAIFKQMMKETRGVRRLGSAALDLAYVACGRFDGFYEYGLHPWDVAAGAFIVQQAGGRVSDFSGGGNYIFGQEIIATNHLLFNPFLNIVQNYFE